MSISSSFTRLESKIPKWTYDPVIQITMGFVFGVILAPFSNIDIKAYTGFLLLYELGIFLITGGKRPYYQIGVRIVVILMSLLGFILGKAIVSNHQQQLFTFAEFFSRKPSEKE